MRRSRGLRGRCSRKKKQCVQRPQGRKARLVGGTKTRPVGLKQREQEEVSQCEGIVRVSKRPDVWGH